jgi:hypothetical protein
MAILIEPDFSGGEYSPAMYGRVDTAEYRKGLKTARNIIIHPYGGASNRSGLMFCGPVKDHSTAVRIIPFRFRTEDVYALEFGHMYMRVLRNGYHVVEEPLDIEDITQADPAVFTITAHGLSDGDEVFVAGIDGPTELNGGRYIVDDATTDTFTLGHQVTGDDISSAAMDAYVSGGKVAKIFEIATPYDSDDLFEIKFTQSADVITLAHRDYDVKDLQRLGHTNWQLVDPDFEPTIGTPANMTVTPQGADDGASYSYRVTAIEDGTFLEGTFAEASTADGATPLTAANSNLVDWDAVANAFRYNVYKLENGLWGFMGTTEGTSFTDDGTVAPNFNTTPPLVNNPFDGANNQPGAVGFFEQRKVYGNTNNQPDTYFCSRIGDFNNFSYSFPGQADDAIEATLNQQQVNEIRHILALNDLLIFTSGAEWRVSAGSDSGFSADTLRQKPQSTWGSSHLAPIVIGNKILFVQELSASVRSFGYSFTDDGWAGADLTLLARHLFIERQMRDWSYGAIPNRLLCAVRDDGFVLPLTFAPDQKVIAWGHWDTKGTFESTTSIPNVGAFEDITYFVARRRVNGNLVRYIERLHTRQYTDVRDCFFVDCGLTMDGPRNISNITVDGDGIITVTAIAHGLMDGEEVDLSDIEWTRDLDESFNEIDPDHLNGGRFTVDDATTDTFTIRDSDGEYVDGSEFSGYIGAGFVRCAVDKIYGLHHLAGETVVMLGDGNVWRDIEVALDGTITLPRKMSRIHLGFPYLSDLELLNIEAPSGTIQGVTKKIPGATVRFENSRGLFFGPNKFKLKEMKWRDNENLGDPTAMFTGDKHMPFSSGWDTNGVIFFRQLDPLPVSWTAVMPDIVVSEPRA